MVLFDVGPPGSLLPGAPKIPLDALVYCHFAESPACSIVVINIKVFLLHLICFILLYCIHVVDLFEVTLAAEQHAACCVNSVLPLHTHTHTQAAVECGPAGNRGLHNVTVVRFSSLKDLGETERVFSPLLLQQSGISQFKTSFFKHSASTSQRLMKGHMVGRMKTWHQAELEGLALFSYQRDPQPVRLNMDFVWKSVSTAEILGPSAG